MRRISGLDALIRRFRERWETDPRYRAAMSGVIGLVVVISMCACMATVSVIANGALAGGGFTTGTGGQQTGGGGVVQAAPSFPTPTEPAWQVPATPVWSPVPDSQTPQPAPTEAPTATPTNTPTTSSGLSGTGSPDPWTYCPGGTKCDKVRIQTPAPGLVLITINYPSSPPTTITDSVTTDASGNATYRFAGPHGTGTASVTLLYGTQTFNFNQSCSG
ncbi:MAG TPA: hypothetical protein VIG30_05130 [Ktedonobacterales bacterium]|jgi:hypothetical protein